MRTGILSVLAICLLSASAAAQEGVELFGYFESQLMGAVIEDRLQHVYSNKLRVDLKFEPSDRITFAANFDYITYHGKTRWDIVDFLSPTSRRRFRRRWPRFTSSRSRTGTSWTTPTSGWRSIVST